MKVFEIDSEASIISREIVILLLVNSASIAEVEKKGMILKIREATMAEMTIRCLFIEMIVSF